jgi:hypothetical protein
MTHEYDALGSGTLLVSAYMFDYSGCVTQIVPYIGSSDS